MKWAGRTIGVPTTGAAAGTMITIDEEVGDTGHAAAVRGDRAHVVVTGNFYSKLLSKVIDGVFRELTWVCLFHGNLYVCLYNPLKCMFWKREVRMIIA